MAEFSRDRQKTLVWLTWQASAGAKSTTTCPENVKINKGF